MLVAINTNLIYDNNTKPAVLIKKSYSFNVSVLKMFSNSQHVMKQLHIRMFGNSIEIRIFKLIFSFNDAHPLKKTLIKKLI